MLGMKASAELGDRQQQRRLTGHSQASLTQVNAHN